MNKLASTLFLCICLILIIAGCARQDAILIRFSAELTGRRGELGVAGRDGAQMAVDIINDNGGIQGRPLKLIVRDDKGDPETARQVDAELVELGVVAIIGHITSEQTASVFDQMNRAKIVLISPTSSSSDFSRQADYFFRVMPNSDLMGKSLADHIYNTHNIRQIVGIYDLNNLAFTETTWHAVQEQFERLGGDSSQSFTFKSGETDLKTLMALVKATEPEALVFIASAIDTALMAQYCQQLGMEATLFSSAWAQSEELIEKGGRAVEGIEISATYNPQEPSPEFQNFLQKFIARYNRSPSLAASHAYEAIMVLAKALETTAGQARGLAEALTHINDFKGIQGSISIDQYGDVQRDVFIAKVHNGQFEIINTITP